MVARQQYLLAVLAGLQMDPICLVVALENASMSMTMTCSVSQSDNTKVFQC
jgi:hypothetical protein